jgi:hypothetical protein
LKRKCAKTTSHALHKEEFVGELAEWTDFERDVHATCRRVDWNRKRNVLCHTTVGVPPHTHLSNEQVRVGDETGVQGQFQQNIGHVMSSIFRVCGIDAAFGDYKSSTNPRIRGKVPDVVMLAETGVSVRIEREFDSENVVNLGRI